MFNMFNNFFYLIEGSATIAMDPNYTITLDLTNPQLLQIVQAELHKARGENSAAKERYDCSIKRLELILKERQDHVGPMVQEINEILTETDKLNALAKENEELANALRKYDPLQQLISTIYSVFHLWLIMK